MFRYIAFQRAAADFQRSSVSAFVVFIFIRLLLPEIPVIALAGERGMSPERHAADWISSASTGRSGIQYLSFLWGMFHGDFGTSIASKRAGSRSFPTLFPATLELSSAP